MPIHYGHINVYEDSRLEVGQDGCSESFARLEEGGTCVTVAALSSWLDASSRITSKSAILHAPPITYTVCGKMTVEGLRRSTRARTQVRSYADDQAEQTASTAPRKRKQPSASRLDDSSDVSEEEEEDANFGIDSEEDHPIKKQKRPSKQPSKKPNNGMQPYGAPPEGTMIPWASALLFSNRMQSLMDLRLRVACAASQKSGSFPRRTRRRPRRSLGMQKQPRSALLHDCMMSNDLRKVKKSIDSWSS